MADRRHSTGSWGRLVAVQFVAVAAVLPITARAADATEQYLREVKPLLAARCYACHGALRQEAGLRLDTAAAARVGGASGPVLSPGDAATSPILARVTATDPVERMPPEGEGEPLEPHDVAAVAAWITAGATGPADERPESDPRDHWAFRPVVRPPVPTVEPGWGRNPIDAFVAATHATHGLRPQPEPARGLLVRRLHLDLVGVPPQPEELAAIEADESPDWYERLVDRLLADPRHGERWARHWMDIWRYSDWWGLGDQLRNSQKHIWHWRDWIVESLDADVPYDEMVRQMLAADELYPDDPARLRATGFLARNWFLFNRTPWLDETVEHVGKGLLGLTLNCAKCHDHKYDPVAQEDFYALRAFFEPYHVRLDVVPGEPDLERDGIPRVFDAYLDTPTYRFIRGEDTKPDTSKPIPPGVPALLAFADVAATPVTLPPTAWQPERRPWVLEAHRAAARRSLEAATAAHEREPSPIVAARLAVARAELEAVERRGEAAAAAWAATAPDDTAAQARRTAATQAAVRAERQVVAARALVTVAEAEAKLAAAAEAARADAKKAVADARQAADKAAQAVGEPGESFTPFVGARWTPTRFKTSTADDPAPAFPATSTGRRTALARWITDPRHPLTARVAVNHIWMRHLGTPLVKTVSDFGRKGELPTHPELLDWLASEFVTADGPDTAWRMKRLHRLIVTSATYRMGSSLAGAAAAAASDPDDRLLWRRQPQRLEAQVIRDCVLALAGTLDPARGGPPVPPGDQAASLRRSLYFVHSDISRNPFLATFDDALVKECYRREQSIVPQQALALANAGFVHDAAERIAARVAAKDAADATFIAAAFHAVLCRPPAAAETEACQAALGRWRALAEPAGPSGIEPARAHLVWALLNHTDFVTLR